MLPTGNTYAAKKTVRQIYNYKAQAWKRVPRRKEANRISDINHKEQAPMANKQKCLRRCLSAFWFLAGKFGRMFFFLFLELSSRRSLSISYRVWHLSKTGTFTLISSRRKWGPQTFVMWKIKVARENQLDVSLNLLSGTNLTSKDTSHG